MTRLCAHSRMVRERRARNLMLFVIASAAVLLLWPRAIARADEARQQDAAQYAVIQVGQALHGLDVIPATITPVPEPDGHGCAIAEMPESTVRIDCRVRFQIERIGTGADYRLTASTGRQTAVFQSTQIALWVN